MSLWKIAWRSILQRGLASALTTLSMALGVMLVVAVLLLYGIISTQFQNNSSLGYNMIVGPNKGGKLQLTLNTVYYLSEPVGIIPYSYYLEFKDAQERSRYDGVEERDGKFAAFTAAAIPVCLGDYLGRFRVVGTTPDMFEELRYGPEANLEYEFAAGRNFQTRSEEHGFFEAVLGSAVARELGISVGETISPSHGVPGGHEHEQKFTVVGVLRPTGTPNDRAAFINVEGFYLMADHATPLEEFEMGENEVAAESEEEPAATAKKSEAPKSLYPTTPLPVNERAVSGVLVRTISPLVTAGLVQQIDRGRTAQAVLPVREIYNLFENIVGPIQAVLLALTVMICIVSGLSILVSIYNSMSDRRHEIAVMRALGASRTVVGSIVLIEAILLSLGGAALGFVAGHGLIASAGGIIEERTGVQIGFFDFAPPMEDVELWIGGPLLTIPISTELWVLPSLILLAILVGFWPAVEAYRTDVARSL
ncbi:MAG: ABC transporter permease [Planctomycetes bacterium]|nr:ABC transporter permease [Planctomycetota bacterium]